MAISFQQVKNIFTGQVDATRILYTDDSVNPPLVWNVPQGHRVWNEIYQPWLAAGNTPQAAT